MTFVSFEINDCNSNETAGSSAGRIILAQVYVSSSIETPDFDLTPNNNTLRVT
jgi:hypothetical protein